MTQNERAVVRKQIADLEREIAAVQADADSDRGEVDVSDLDRWLGHRRHVLGRLLALR